MQCIHLPLKCLRCLLRHRKMTFFVADEKRQKKNDSTQHMSQPRMTPSEEGGNLRRVNTHCEFVVLNASSIVSDFVMRTKKLTTFLRGLKIFVQLRTKKTFEPFSCSNYKRQKRKKKIKKKLNLKSLKILSH